MIIRQKFRKTGLYTEKNEKENIYEQRTGKNL